MLSESHSTRMLLARSWGAWRKFVDFQQHKEATAFKAMSFWLGRSMQVRGAAGGVRGCAGLRLPCTQAHDAAEGVRSARRAGCRRALQVVLLAWGLPCVLSVCGALSKGARPQSAPGTALGIEQVGTRAAHHR